MNITGPLRTLILDNPAAAALLGEKVYPVLAPQEVSPPFALISVIANEGSPIKGAVSPVDFVTFGVATYAKTYNIAQQSDAAVRAGLDGYRGAVTVGSDTFAFDCVQYLDTTDRFEADGDLYNRVSQYRVRWLRDATTVSPGPTLPAPLPDTISVVSGQALSTGRVVIIDDDTAIYFQPSVAAHAGRAIGITKTSASAAGQLVTVQISGIIADPAFTFTPDSGLYAIANGQITSNKPSTAAVQYVGVSTAANTMKIEFTDTLQLT